MIIPSLDTNINLPIASQPNFLFVFKPIIHFLWQLIMRIHVCFSPPPVKLFSNPYWKAHLYRYVETMAVPFLSGKSKFTFYTLPTPIESSAAIEDAA